MAESLELTTTLLPEVMTKELNTVQVLAAGESIKMELGGAELDADVPEGETWTVHAIIEVTVT